MNKDIAEYIKSYLTPLSFVDKIAGLVKVASISQPSETGVVVKRFPVACDVNYSDCVKQSRYKDLMPDSSKMSVIYFEDLGCTFVNKTARSFEFISNLKLIGWVNLSKFQDISCDNSSVFVASIIKALPNGLYNYGRYSNIQIVGIREEPKTNQIFSMYTYDELVNQYLLYPYDYFSLSISVSFNLPINCIEEIIPSTENCNTLS
jgi:hypothetical protein